MPAIPSGETCLFHQNNSPVGWTKLTDIDDHAVRLTTIWASGSQGNTSSPVLQPFNTVFSSNPFNYTINPFSGTSQSTTLTASSIPPHTHRANGNTTITTTANHPTTVRVKTSPPPATPIQAAAQTVFNGTTTDVGGGGHTHPLSLSVPSSSLSGTLNFSIKYVDVIRATRD